MTKIPPLSPHLVLALLNRRQAIERNWKSALWSLPKHLQQEILFYSNDCQIPCRELMVSTWQLVMLQIDTGTKS